MKRFVCALAGLALSGICTPAQAQQGMLPREPAHKEMARDAGVWDAEVKMWVEPAAEPITSKAVETNKTLGDYWVESEFAGDVGGQKFIGKGVLGYDPVSKKFVGTWYDTMTPFMSVGEGAYDVKTHTLTMEYKARDPMSREIKTSKMVTRYLDADSKVFEIHGPGDDGKMWKMLEATYKRRKE